MGEIRILKSIVNDYFAMQKNNGVLFYFKKEDLKPLIEKLIELKEEIICEHQRIKIYCYKCETVLKILDNGTCYCKECDEFFSEGDIRINCGI